MRSVREVRRSFFSFQTRPTTPDDWNQADVRYHVMREHREPGMCTAVYQARSMREAYDIARTRVRQTGAAWIILTVPECCPIVAARPKVEGPAVRAVFTRLTTGVS